MQDYRMETFMSVCETLNYTKTALHLHMTQPAVSQHIHYLEEYYQVKLFEIVGKQVYKTKAGEKLYQATLTMRHDENSLRDLLKEEENETMPLSLGTTKTIGDYVMGHPLACYMKDHPQRHINVTIDNTRELLEKLRQGSLDMVLVEGYFDPSGYESMVFSSEPFLGVAHKDYHFSHDIKTLSDLKEEKLILREEGSGTREILEKALSLENKNLSFFPHQIVMSSMPLIVDLLKEGCGISFLYQAAIKEELAQGILVPLPLSQFNVMHDFTFLWNKGSLFQKEYEEIGQLLKTYYDVYH